MIIYTQTVPMAQALITCPYCDRFNVVDHLMVGTIYHKECPYCEGKFTAQVREYDMQENIKLFLEKNV